MAGQQACVRAPRDDVSRLDPWSGSLHLIAGVVSRACEPDDRSRGQLGLCQPRLGEHHQINTYTEKQSLVGTTLKVK